MSTIRYDFDVSLDLIAPFSIPGSATATLGLDMALARNGQGQVVLPASLLKGVLRHACEDLAKAAPDAMLEGEPLPDLVVRLFGPPFGSSTTGEDDRGALVFSDLTTDPPPETQEGRFVRVSIDPDTETAKEGHLQFIELPWPIGTPVTFRGKASLLDTDAQAASRSRTLVQRGLDRVIAIGGAKSAGFGEVRRPKIAEAKPVIATPKSDDKGRLTLCYSIDRPFVVDATREGSNFSAGSSVIPGGAIKAVVARALAAAGWADDALLAQTRFGHAFAQGPTGVLPLSLYTHENRLHCALGAQDLPRDVRFAIDWKGDLEEKIQDKLGVTPKPLKRIGATRTSIDPEQQTVRYSETEGGALFSTVAVDPEGMLWSGEIALPKDPTFCERVLAVLEAGCLGLGKTKAMISVCHPPSPAKPDPWDGGVCAITLMTPAILTPPDPDFASAFDAYEAYFADMGLTLKDAYATQSLKGGYLALRYKPVANRYMPWITTEPGSVFLVDADKGSAGATALVDALAHGLKPASGYSEDWRDMPFLRENGFGQITRNLVPHDTLAGGMDLP